MNEVVEKKQTNPLVEIRDALEARSAQFVAALPKHIPMERFKRVLLTAIQQNPKLAGADRPSLFTSAMKAAQDGLLPDGREGALVIYNTKIKINGAEKWVDAVQWMPMIAGIRKKVRNSKEIATWDVKAVYERDKFIYEDGLELILKHVPFIDGDAGKLRAVYSVARLKTGEVTVDVMPVHQVERIRLMSKAKDKGPWVDHFDEMAKKTVARRHSKVLPMSTDLDDLIRRDDELYDMAGASDRQVAAGTPRPQLSDFTSLETSAPTDTKPGTEQLEPEQVRDEAGEAQPAKAKTEKAAKGKTAEKAPAQAQPEEQAQPGHDPDTGEIHEEESSEPSRADAYKLGEEARSAGKALRAVPPEFRDAAMATFAEAWQEGWRSRDEELVASAKKK